MIGNRLIYCILIFILLSCISCNRDQEFQQKIREIETGMKIHDVKKILGEPNDVIQYKTHEGRDIIVYYYETQKWYESKYEIIFSKKDSTVFIQEYQKM